MQVRTFRARSLEEALGRVQQELGPDAQVLQARELETSWWERVSRGRQYEIRTREHAGGPLPLRKSGSGDWDAFGAASADDGRASTDMDSRHGSDGSGDRQVPDFRDGVAWERFASDRMDGERGEDRLPRSGDAPRMDGAGLHPQTSELDACRQRFQDFTLPGASDRAGNAGNDPFELGASPRTELPASPFRRSQAHYSPRILEVISRLIEADVTPHAARDLVDAVREANPDHAGWTVAEWQQGLVEHLRGELPPGGELRVRRGHRKVVAVVGPTGAGKTTTIAKLAARWRLEQHLKVALVSVDTYRVAAVEQLRTYADIMGLPMEVVATPKEMHAAIARFADCDVVLVDTAGRSPHDNLQLQELRALVAETQAEDVLLVLNGPSSASHHRLAAHRFLEVGATGLVVTKLDEATSLGSLLQVVRETRLPVHYLTCGQSVPEDLTPADPNRLIPALLGCEAADHGA